VRMISAFCGTRMLRAFSTERTEASACTVVQDAADALAKAQASRGRGPAG